MRSEEDKPCKAGNVRVGNIVPSPKWTFSITPGLPILKEPAILAFRIYPAGNASNLKFQVIFGYGPSKGVVCVATVNHLGTDFRTVHVVIPKKHINPSGNEVTFKIIGGAGEMIVSDIVFWYKPRSTDA